MQLHLLDERLRFPDVEDALPDGLLAIGGDLSTERLILAYRNGIFPWFDDDTPMWWSPDPRFVLFPEEIKVSKSMKQLIKKNAFDFSVDSNFKDVITNCQKTLRRDQDGTWITEDVRNAYIQLHKLGYAHSAEAWHEGKLVGGLYGIRMGKAFFGESMFSHQSNASKYAFIKMVQLLKEEGVQLIDCQVHTNHLESLGARMIPRVEFITRISELIDA